MNNLCLKLLEELKNRRNVEALKLLMKLVLLIERECLDKAYNESNHRYSMNENYLPRAWPGSS